jgi:1-acyl-sn-glycerol-3-phosphate acyltransferase
MYGIFSWIALAAVILPTIGLVAVLPQLDRRRALVGWAARLFLRITGCSPAITGLENLPPEPCIVVANHASYLDGIILAAALPPRFGFVIKREMTQVPLAHFLLRRIGSQFVDRYDSRRGATDARRLLSRAAERQSLAFFPEGTFCAEPGLRRFHNGAFAAAIRGGVPIAPVVIRGSRDMLPAEQWLPRRGRLEVIFRPPVWQHPAADPVSWLLNACRRSILEELAEPDATPGITSTT